MLRDVNKWHGLRDKLVYRINFVQELILGTKRQQVDYPSNRMAAEDLGE